MAKNITFISFNITLVIALIFLWTIRWDYSPKVTSYNGEYVQYSITDKWNGQVQTVTHVAEENSRGFRAKYGDRDIVEESNFIPSNILTSAWFILTFISLFNVIRGLLLHTIRDKPLQ